MITARGLSLLRLSPTGNLTPDYTISGFPEYKTEVRDLEQPQQAELRRMASRIVQSLFTRFPVRGVVVVGNADVALRKPVGQRSEFEFEVSRQRAASGESALLDEIARVSGSPSGRYLIKTTTVGVGSTKLAVAHPRNEAEMRKNRRVEFTLVSEAVSEPSCACPS